MDGFQERLKRSIQWRLAWGLSAAIVLMALLAGSVAFYTAFREANELQDDILRQVAALIRQQPASAWQQLNVQGTHGQESAFESHLLVQALPTAAQPHPPGALGLPATLADGLHSLTLDDDRYRVLVASLADGRRFVVAQETQLRDDIALNSAALTVLPLLVLVPVLLLVVTLLSSLAFLYPSSGGQKINPMRATINAVLHAPIKDLAPVVGVTTEELTARLAHAGVTKSSPADSIQSLAKANQTEAMKLLAAVMSPRSLDGDKD